MTTPVRPAYGTADQAVTISLGGLTNGAARESTVIDNSATPFYDVLVTVKVKSGAGAVGSDQAVNVFFYGTVGGTTYPDTVTGADAAITLDSPTQLGPPAGVVRISVAATTFKSNPISVRSAFGGTMPSKWGVVIQNKAGQTLDASNASHSVTYQGQYDQVD